MSKKNKITTLERSLKRFITADNLDQLHDQAGFDEFCTPFFARPPVLSILEEYLHSRQYSPRILALLVYSEPGRTYLCDLLKKGLDSHLIYRKMMYEGSFWQSTSPPFVLGQHIAQGDALWEFDTELLFPKIEPITCLPGLIEAMIERVRQNGQFSKLLTRCPDNTLIRIINEVPMALAPELDPLMHLKDVEGDRWAQHVLMQIKKAHLSEQTIFETLIGHRCA